jgi:hypothetical protein
MRAPPRFVPAGVGLVAAALVAAACGFQDQPRLGGARPGDGVSAWADQGAVLLCLANDRIGPRAAGAAGFCVDENAPPEEICRSDGDCGSRELCVCGRCTVAACTSNGECPRGRACSFQEKRCATPCSEDTDCRGRAEFCSSGFCKGRCGADDDCQTGEFCGQNGRCLVDPCQDDGACDGSSYCRKQRQGRTVLEPSALAGPAAHGQGPGQQRFVLWFEMDNAAGTSSAIYRAVSDDGRRYVIDPAEPVLSDGGDARAPSAVATATGIDLYFEAAAGIRRASSPDGVDFGPATTVIPGDVHSPGAAATPGGEVVVVVAAGDRRGLSIWRPSGSLTPLLGPGDVTLPELWRNVERLGGPAIAIEPGSGGPLLRVWFDAFGAESGDSVQFGEVKPLPPNDSIGYASGTLTDSPALVAHPYNPVFDRVRVFLDHRAERTPTVVRDAGANVWFLYYRGTSADGTVDDGLGVAVNPPPLPE